MSLLWVSVLWLPCGLYKLLHRLLCCVCAHLLSCVRLCDPTDGSPPGSSVHGIFQAGILEWVAIFPLQGIFPSQGLNLCFLYLLHWQANSLPLGHLGNPFHRLHSSVSTERLSSSFAYADFIFLFFPFSFVATNYSFSCCEFITKLK